VLFAKVETDQGITGFGLTRGAQRFGLREFINRELAPFLRDKNPLETERVWQQLYTPLIHADKLVCGARQ
jgi:L-alanine-DL-glutamate epimerase-like enolase superfamily enzyme